MRQLAAVFLALALLAAACGGSDTAGPSTSSDNDVVPAQADSGGDQGNAGNDDVSNGGAVDASEAAALPEPATTSDRLDDGLSAGFVPAVQLSVETIRVGYLQKWPTPNLQGLADGSFDLAVGANVNWVPFGSSAEMAPAMEAGEIDIAYSHDVAAFANAVNQGAEISLVGIAATYVEAVNCVVHPSLGLTRDNATETLEGARVLTPSGGATQLKMLLMMEFLGVDVDSLAIIGTDSSSTVASAFEAGDGDVGCAIGGPLTEMIDEVGGELLMAGPQQAAELGLNTYGVVSIPTAYGDVHRDAVVSFLGATQFFNENWARDPEAANDMIASSARMEHVDNFLSGPTWLSFPSIPDQLSAAWMSGTVADDMDQQMQALVDLQQIDTTIGDFSGSIDLSFLEEAIAG